MKASRLIGWVVGFLTVAALATVFVLMVGRREHGAKVGVRLAMAVPVVPPTVNVLAYGAKCDGVTDDTAADQAAINAVCSAGGGTVLVPGMSAVTGLTSPAAFQGHLAIRGTSQASGFALLSDAPVLIDFELGTGPNSGEGNFAEVDDLRFESNGFQGGAAVKVGYGVIASNSTTTGPIAHNLTIQGGGWANGIALINAWNARVSECFGYGNATTYDSATGAGSGAMIAFIGQCVNETVEGIHCNFWASALSAVAGPGTTFQGFEISNVNAVQTPRAFLFSGDQSIACGAIQMTTILVDNGNLHGQSHGYTVDATDVNDISLSNFNAIDNSADPCCFLFTGCDNPTLSRGEASTNYPAPIGVSLVGCNGASVTRTLFLGFTNEVVLDDGTANSVVADCQVQGGGAISPLDLGYQNKVGDSRGLTAVWSLAGGKTSETFLLDVSACAFGKKPNGATVQITSMPGYLARYDWDGADNTAKQIDIVVWNTAGLTNGGWGFRVSAVAAP